MKLLTEPGMLKVSIEEPLDNDRIYMLDLRPSQAQAHYEGIYHRSEKFHPVIFYEDQSWHQLHTGYTNTIFYCCHILRSSFMFMYNYAWVM